MDDKQLSEKVRKALELNRLKKEGLPEIREMEAKIVSLENQRRDLNRLSDILRSNSIYNHFNDTIVTEKEFESDEYKVDTYFGRSLKVEYLLVSFWVVDSDESKATAIAALEALKNELRTNSELISALNRAIEELRESVQIAKNAFRKALAAEEEVMEFNVPEEQKELLKAVLALVDKRFIPLREELRELREEFDNYRSHNAGDI